MKQGTHLSVFGIGPVYAILCAALTLAACLLDRTGQLPRFAHPWLSAVLRIAAILWACLAVCLWVDAVLIQHIDKHIKADELVTTGAYAYVRNPIYSAILFLMWACLAWQGNLWLLVLYPVYPLLMAVLLKHTEEKWLMERYGEAYRAYCERVSRWFPRLPKR